MNKNENEKNKKYTNNRPVNRTQSGRKGDGKKGEATTIYKKIRGKIVKLLYIVTWIYIPILVYIH